MPLEDSRAAEAATSARQKWMSLLASARPARLNALFPRDDFPKFVYLRKPETGLVMVRGRLGGTGSPFNIGETTVTRCTIRLDDGTIGHAFVMGRSHEHAVTAAVCDAMLQGSAGNDLAEKVVTPLAQERAERERQLALQNAATKVDFFTMVRGDDD
jgi:alpha-D-ribose 1-methylphosphonate 5-triphosphate synthase subunit PhnG